MGLLDILSAGLAKGQGLLGKVETRLGKEGNRGDVETLVKKIFPKNAWVPILANIEQESSFNWEAGKGSRAEGLFQFRHNKAFKEPYAEYLEYNKLEDSAKSQLTFVRDMLYGNKATGFPNKTLWKGDNDTERPTIGSGHGDNIRKAFETGWEEGTDVFMREFERPVSDWIYIEGEEPKRKEQEQINREGEAEYNKRIGHAQGWVDRFAAMPVPQTKGLLSEPMAMP